MATLTDALKKLEQKDRLERLDGNRPGSRPTEQQARILQAILSCEKRVIQVRAGNQSGKSATITKAFAVMFAENPEHPWRRPEHWTGPLLFMLMGKQTKQIEESLLPKLLGHLPQDTYKVVRVGNVVNKVVNTVNGNTILCFSHHNVQQAREAIQSFTGHVVCIDELPADPSVIEEATKRVLVNRGSVVLTFTPKVPRPKVKKFLDETPEAQMVTFTMSSLNNPSMDEQTKLEMVADAKARGEQHLKTVLEGAWATGENAVYNYDPHNCLRPLPASYSPRAWQHAACADPASSSETGVVVLAQDPEDHTWYTVHASYVRERDPAQLVREVEIRLLPYRIVRRVYDSAATWFEGAARAQGHIYMPIMNKANRKDELIANVNKVLGKKLFLTPGCETLEDELASAQWSETGSGKISHAHIFHTADALCYLVDLLPRAEAPAVRAYEGTPEQAFTATLRTAALEARFSKGSPQSRIKKSKPWLR